MDPMIGRAHLDDAFSEGRAAGARADGAAEECPYASASRPMTRHAWMRGFNAAVAERPPAG